MGETVPNANDYDARVANIAVTLLLQENRKEVTPFEIAAEMGLKVTAWKWVNMSLTKAVQNKMLKRSFVRISYDFQLPVYTLP